MTPFNPSFFSALHDEAWKKFLLWILAGIAATLFFIAATGRDMVREAVQQEVLAITSPVTDSLEDEVAALKREQASAKAQQEAFMVASMLTNPELYRALRSIAEAKESGRVAQGEALDIVRKLSQ